MKILLVRMGVCDAIRNPYDIFDYKHLYRSGYMDLISGGILTNSFRLPIYTKTEYNWISVEK